MYLLVKGTALDESTLTDSAKFKSIPLKKKDGIEWKLFTHSSLGGKARWTKDLELITASGSLDHLRTQSSSAVLLAKSKNRIFAITFGHGFHAVRPQVIERGFGLRVTANSISSSRLKSADTRALSRGGRSQKTMLPVASELFALGIEPAEEWVRQLSGSADSSDFATTAAGADSLRLSVANFSLDHLPDKLKEVKKLYKSNKYRKQFSFLDNFLRIDPKDPIVDELNAELEKLLAARDPDVYFAAPEPFEQIDVESYQLQWRKKVELESLEQAAIYSAFDQLNSWPDKPLDKVYIEAFNSDGTRIDKRYPISEYIQAEIPRGSVRYVLSAGLWFRVSQSYVDEVADYVAGIPDATADLNLPTWPKDSGGKSVDEGDYNTLVSTSEGYAILDKKNLHFGQQRKIEICDLLTPEQDLICVKRATSSSTLSHLFSQGSVSASLMHETEYQDALTPHLTALGIQPSFDTPSDWRFVYAVGTSKPGSLAQSLFFFSQVNLVTHVRAIRSRGHKVALAKVEM